MLQKKKKAQCNLNSLELLMKFLPVLQPISFLFMKQWKEARGDVYLPAVVGSVWQL